jgi:hypothetical protein
MKKNYLFTMTFVVFMMSLSFSLTACGDDAAEDCSTMPLLADDTALCGAEDVGTKMCNADGLVCECLNEGTAWECRAPITNTVTEGESCDTENETGTTDAGKDCTCSQNDSSELIWVCSPAVEYVTEGGQCDTVDATGQTEGGKDCTCNADFIWDCSSTTECTESSTLYDFTQRVSLVNMDSSIEIYYDALSGGGELKVKVANGETQVGEYTADLANSGSLTIPSLTNGTTYSLMFQASDMAGTSCTPWSESYDSTPLYVKEDVVVNFFKPGESGNCLNFDPMSGIEVGKIGTDPEGQYHNHDCALAFVDVSGINYMWAGSGVDSISYIEVSDITTAPTSGYTEIGTDSYTLGADDKLLNTKYVFKLVSNDVEYYVGAEVSDGGVTPPDVMGTDVTFSVIRFQSQASNTDI